MNVNSDYVVKKQRTCLSESFNERVVICILPILLAYSLMWVTSLFISVCGEGEGGGGGGGGRGRWRGRRRIT